MKKTTSIKIDPEIWIEAKIKCLRKGMELGQYIEYLIEKDFKKGKK